MAYQMPGKTDGSKTAGADLTGWQFKAVKLNASAQVILVAATTDRPYGILQNTPNVNEPTLVMVDGISKAVAGAAFGVDAVLSVDAQGRVVPVVPGTDTTRFLIGRSLQAATAALDRAAEIRSTIASGFGLEWQSKKYRKQSQTMITSKLREFDALMPSLQRAVEIASAAGERAKRLVPEFAMGDWLRKANGGRLIRVAEGGYDEVVLTTDPKHRARSAALLTQYVARTFAAPAANPQQTSFATSGVATANGASVQPVLNITVINEFDSVDGRIRTWIQTDDGEKHLAKSVKNLKRNGEI